MTDDTEAAVAAILADLESSPPVPPPASDWPDAKALCLQVGAAMKNLPAYRQGMAAAGIIDLAYEFSVIAHLVILFRQSEEGVAKLAGPALERLRDICAAEGLRRGVMLQVGNDVGTISLAVEIMDEMIAAFSPSWASFPAR